MSDLIYSQCDVILYVKGHCSSKSFLGSWCSVELRAMSVFIVSDSNKSLR